MRTFLSKIDNWLAVRYPILWATGLFKVVFWVFSVYLISAIVAYFYAPDSMEDIRYYAYFFVKKEWLFYIPAILALFWANFRSKRNSVEKNFGIISTKMEWLRHGYIVMMTSLILFCPFLLKQSINMKIHQVVSRSEIEADIKLLRKIYGGQIYYLSWKEEKKEEIVFSEDSSLFSSSEFLELHKKYTGEEVINRNYDWSDYASSVRLIFDSYNQPLGGRYGSLLSYAIILAINIFLIFFYSSWMDGFLASIFLLLIGMMLFAGAFFLLGLLAFFIKSKEHTLARLERIFLLISPAFPIFLLMIEASGMFIALITLLLTPIWIYWTAPRLRRLYASPNAS